MAELADKIAALLPRAKGNPAAMIQLARMLKKNGEDEKALAMCRAALLLAPQDAKLAYEAKFLINVGVPQWHFSIVKDAVRNAAYDAALRQAVTPDTRVLEIGTGTGILAMMAARAGARHVVTCEMNPAVAEKAIENIARNGYANRVRVVSKHSGKLDIDADLGGRADILVSEIVSNNLLSEDVLPAHEQAMRDLMKPGAQVIPARGTVRVALAYDERDEEAGLGQIAGFDLSAFESLQLPARPVPVGQKELALLSDPADLFAFDFASAKYCAPSQSLAAVASTGGRANGVAQWIALELDAATHYENRPVRGAKSCWAMMFYPFVKPVETKPGEIVRICGSHDRHRIVIWPQFSSSRAG